MEHDVAFKDNFLSNLNTQPNTELLLEMESCTVKKKEIVSDSLFVSSFKQTQLKPDQENLQFKPEKLEIWSKECQIWKPQHFGSIM